MTDFPSRWAPQHPDRIQLYSLATPNGKKAGIALEELELPYEAHRIDIMAGDQFDPEYVKINPNSKIPA
ncbi:MAG: glutathione S-transferase N-terminal domain-containing protein, partial [Myxococcota bacterium]